MSSEIGTAASSSNRELTIAWAIFTFSLLAIAGALASPYMFLVVLALLVTAVVMLRMAKSKAARVPLILSIVSDGGGLLLVLVATIALYATMG